MSKVEIKTFGFDDARKRMMAVARFVNNVPDRLATSISGEVRIAIKRRPQTPGRSRKTWTRSQQWERSVEYTASKTVVEIFYNLGVAIYARMRELGGTILPFRAKFLFIPLRPDVRPNQPGLKFGEDFVLAKKAVQKGSHIMRDTVRHELFDAGSKTMKTLHAKLKAAWETGSAK